MLQCLLRWAAALRRYSLAVYYLARDPRVPLLPRLLALLVAAYALSPIDLIPDFIPLLGYLDDLLLLPLGLALVLRLTPAALVEDALRRAETTAQRPVSHAAAGVILLLWLVLALLAWWHWRG